MTSRGRRGGGTWGTWVIDSLRSRDELVIRRPEVLVELKPGDEVAATIPAALGAGHGVRTVT